MDRTSIEMTPEHKQTLLDIIDKIWNRKDAIDFRYPVDYEAFGIDD
jgi:hypothetical protein